MSDGNHQCRCAHQETVIRHLVRRVMKIEQVMAVSVPDMERVYPQEITDEQIDEWLRSSYRNTVPVTAEPSLWPVPEKHCRT